jgi:hypothetical protein
MSSRETSTSLMTYLPEEGILIVRAKTGEELTLEHAKADCALSREMVGDKRVAVLSDVRLLDHHYPEVRDFYATEEMQERISAMAVLLDSLPLRLIGNFFIYVSRPPYPTRLFTKEESAIDWLRTFIVS